MNRRCKFKSKGIASGHLVVAIVLAVGLALATVSVSWWLMQTEARKKAPEFRAPQTDQQPADSNDSDRQAETSDD